MHNVFETLGGFVKRPACMQHVAQIKKVFVVFAL